MPDEGIDKFAGYRQSDEIINIAHLEREEPHLFQKLTEGDLPPFRKEILYWDDSVAFKYGLNASDAARLKSYIESKASPRVLFNTPLYFSYSLSTIWLRK